MKTNLVPKFGFMTLVTLLLLQANVHAQIELKPSSLEFNSLSSIYYSSPNLNIGNFYTGPLFQLGNIRFSASGKFVFGSNIINGSSLSISNNSKLSRSTSGSTDLLPYAYGKIAPSTNDKVAGTDNFTFERSGAIVKIHLAENVANELVIMVTPHCYISGFTSFCEPEIITEIGAVDIINVKLETANTPFSFVAYKQ